MTRKPAMSVTEALLAIDASPLLMDSITDALVESKTPAPDRDLCYVCGAYLYVAGWLHGQTLQIYGGREDKPKTVKQRRKQAVTHLRAAGILPVAFSWEWFVIRWVVLPFLSALIQSWLLDRYRDAGRS